MMLTLVSDRYTESGTFQGSDAIQSPQFGTLNFTVAQVLPQQSNPQPPV